jgi:hypothetical protein
LFVALGVTAWSADPITDEGLRLKALAAIFPGMTVEAESGAVDSKPFVLRSTQAFARARFSISHGRT